jgi:hypothetical protein
MDMKASNISVLRRGTLAPFFFHGLRGFTFRILLPFGRPFVASSARVASLTLATQMLACAASAHHSSGVPSSWPARLHV